MSSLRFPTIIIFLVLWFHPTSSTAQIVLNEIQASNNTTIADDDGDYEDWIELYNTSGNETVDLSGYGLSDDYERPFRWVFPEGTSIDPGEHLLIWASGKDRRDPAQALHTNFSIAQAGEEVLLTDPYTEERIDEISPTEIPSDISYGRKTDGADEWMFFTTPTPGTPNSGPGYADLLERVVFSVTGGFFTSPVTVELSSPQDDVIIRYTLDGSEPAEDSPVYEAPLYIEDRTNEPNDLSTILDISHNYSNAAPPAGNVFKGTVVRASAFREGSLPGPVETNTYFVHELGRDRFSLPVISLSTDRDSLFDYERGIYVLGKLWYDDGANNHSLSAPANYRQRGSEWERPMHVELFEPNGTTGISQLIGVRLHGGASRAFPQKSFRLYSRSDYGTSRFSYRVFPDLELEDFNRLILRNSGQDVTQTLFRDAYVQEATKHMNYITMASRPVIVFINGEYWGIYNIRERYDKHFLETHFGVDPERIDFLTGNYRVKEGSNFHYTNQLLAHLELNDISLPHHYDHVKTLMDVDNFTDYYIAQIFIRNTDWPHGNIDFWRYRTTYNPDAPISEQDGRWRWMMFDTDFGFGWQPENWDLPPQNRWDIPRDFDRQSYIRNMMIHVTDTSTRPWATFVFRTLMENEEFRTGFLNRFADMLNTTFRPGRMIEVLDSMKAVYAPEIQEHINRWSKTEPPVWQHFYRPFITFEEWEGEVGVLEEFAQKRPAYQWDHLMWFEGRDTLGVTLYNPDPQSGYIRINTIDISPSTVGVPDEPYPWTGTYFNGLPLTVTAKPKPGFRFAGWGEYPDHTSSTLTVTPQSDISITALFETAEDHDPPAHRLADGLYAFHYWPSDAPAGTFPENMIFMYMDRKEPGLDAFAEDKTSGKFDLDSRTRINGFGGDGFAFINTSNEEGNPGYPGRRLGAAVLGLDTRGHQNVYVSWTGGTVNPNSRIYNIRLEYRVGTESHFAPVPDEQGYPVEYKRNTGAGHSEQIGPVLLPEDVNDQPYVQLRWRYYFTGEREDDEDGSRSQLRVTDIEVTGIPITSVREDDNSSLPEYYKLEQNYPNPFNNSTIVSYQLPETAHARLDIYSILGQRVKHYDQGRQPAGIHTVHIDAGSWASGVYIVRLHVEGESGQSMDLRPIRMMLLR